MVDKVVLCSNYRVLGREARLDWGSRILCCTLRDGANDISADHFFQQLPHKDATSTDYHLVQDFSFTSADLEGFLEGQVHEDVNTNHDAFDLPSSIKFDAEFLGNVLVEVG